MDTIAHHTQRYKSAFIGRIDRHMEQLMKPSDSAKTARILVSTLISATALVFAVLYVFSNRLAGLHLDKNAIRFLIAAALPWIMARLESFKGFGFEFKQRLDAQNIVIQEQQELLNLMFWFSMEADMFDTLRNLVESGEFIHNPKDKRFYPIVNAQLKELFNRASSIETRRI
jgi:hypothetical protein